MKPKMSHFEETQWYNSENSKIFTKIKDSKKIYISYKCSLNTDYNGW